MMLADHADETGSLMADRLATESQGNVIMTAQAASEETINNEVVINPSDAAGTGDLSGTQDVILEKYYHLKDIIWNHSNSKWHEATEFEFPHGLFPANLDTIYVLAQYFQFLCFYRFDVVIKITCNFSPGCSGILLVFYEPVSYRGLSNVKRNPMTTRVLPHATINAKSASEAQFTIPFNHQVRMYHDSMQKVGDVKKLDWVPLSAVAGTQSDVTLSTWFHLENVQCASMSLSRQPFTTAQYADTKRSFQRALNLSMGEHGHGVDFLKDFLRRVIDTGLERKCLSALTDDVVSGVENLTLLMEDEMDSEVGDDVKNFSMITANTANNLSANVPIHDLSFDGDVPPCTSSFSSHKPFAFQDYMTVPSALAVVEVNKDHNPGHLLASFPVCPDYCFSEAIKTRLAMWDTTTSAIAKHYGYWRGSMKLTIEDAASRLHSFRYKVIYVPNVTKLDKSVDEYASCQTVTCDIGLQELVTMTVSFQAPTDWKRCIEFHDNVANFKAKCSELQYSTGQIGIYVMNPLNSTSASSDHIHLVPQWSWEVEFAYPLWQPQHLSIYGYDDSEVGDAQGTMVGSNEQDGSGGVAFETDQSLPDTYMGNHADINKLMTRPVYLNTLTFSGSATEQSIKLEIKDHQEHIQALSTFYRARPIVTVYTRANGNIFKGNVCVCFAPDHFHPFGNAGNNYLDASKLMLANGGYMMNIGQEKTAVFSIPWYHNINYLQACDTLGTIRFYPMNATFIMDVYLSWGADYNQYFPMRTPIVYDKTISVEPEEAPFRQLELKHEANEQFSAEDIRTMKKLCKFMKKVDIGDIDLSDDDTEYGSIPDLTVDGDVESNPGPTSWEGLLSNYIRPEWIPEVLVEDYYKMNDDEQRVHVYERFLILTDSEVDYVRESYLEEAVYTEDYVPPNVAFAVQLAIDVWQFSVQRNMQILLDDIQEQFDYWVDHYPEDVLDTVVSPFYLVDRSEGMKKCTGKKYIERDEFWEEMEDDYLDWLSRDPADGIFDEWMREMSGWFDGIDWQTDRAEHLHEVMWCQGQKFRTWSELASRSLELEMDEREFVPMPVDFEGQEAVDETLRLANILTVDGMLSIWQLCGTHGSTPLPTFYTWTEEEFMAKVTAREAENPEGVSVMGYVAPPLTREMVIMLGVRPNDAIGKVLEMWTYSAGVTSIVRIEFDRIQQFWPRAGPVMRAVCPGITDLRFLLLLAGDVEENPGPVHSRMVAQEKVKVYQARIKEIFDKFSHKKLSVNECPLSFLNALRQNVAFNVLQFNEFSTSQTVRVCTLIVKIDLREQGDFEVNEKYDEIFSCEGPSKKFTKTHCANMFIEHFFGFLEEQEMDNVLKRLNVGGEMQAEGLFDGVIDTVIDRVTGKEPVVKMLKAVESITKMIGKVDKYVSDGVAVVVGILGMLVKIILGVLNIRSNPSVTNVGYVVANFILDIISSTTLSGIAVAILEKLKTCVYKFFETILEWCVPKTEKEKKSGYSPWKGNEEDEDHDVPSDEECGITHGKMYSNGAPAIMSTMVSMFLIVITGLTGGSDSLTKTSFGGIVAQILKGMKGLSQLGNGMRGMNNIVEYVGKAIKGVVAYVQGGVSDDERANVYFNENREEISKWSVDVDMFKKDYNASEALVDPVLRAKITDLYERGCAIHEGCLFAKDANSVFTKLTINFKDVSDWQRIAAKGGRGVDGRPEPVVVLFRGDPGQGKSLLTLRLSTHFAKFFGKERGNGVHSVNAFSDHMDNYAQQPVIIMDDLGQAAEGKDFENFCQLVSTVPFYPRMADIGQKGDQFISPLLIATSNIRMPRPKTVNTTKAIWRRFAFIIDINAAVKNDRGVLDVEQAELDGTWENLECLELTRFEEIDSTEGSRITLKQLTKEIEDELVRRQKKYIAIVKSIPDPDRSFEGMMASECGECAFHDMNCVCDLCEGLANELLTQEDFDGMVKREERGKMKHATKNAYVDMSDEMLKEQIDTLPEWLLVEYGMDGMTEDFWEKLKTNKKVREYFLMRRMIKEWARREKVNKLRKLWDKHYPGISERLKTTAKICAGILTILTAVSVFQFVSYVRMDKRDQKITTNRALSCRKIHVVAEWLAERGLPCAPKHKMAEVRETIPKYVENDELVFDDGDLITYHDACQLVEDHVCEVHMTHKLHTDANVAKYGDSYDFKAQSEGVYNGGKSVPARKAVFKRVGATRYTAEVGEGNDARDQMAQKIINNVVTVHVLHEDPLRNGHGIATFLSSHEIMMPHHLLSKKGADDIITLRFDMGTSGTKDIQFDPKRVTSFGPVGEIKDFIIYYLSDSISGVRKIPTNAFIKQEDYNSVSLGGVTMLSRRGCNPWLVSTPTCRLVKEKEYQDGQFSVVDGVAYELTSQQRGSGDSGALIMSQHGVARDKVCGMHVCGHEKAGVAFPLTYEFVNHARIEAAKPFLEKPIQGPIELEKKMASECSSLKIEGVNEYLGNVAHNPVSIMRRTQIHKSLIHGCVEVLREPAPLSPNDPRVAEEFKDDPVNNAPKKFCNGHGHANTQHLKEVVDHTANVVKCLINQSDRPRVFSDYEMVNGLPLGEAFQQVEMSSSPGWPYAQMRPGGKKAWFNFEGKNLAGNIYAMKPELKIRVDLREEEAQARVRMPESYFTTFLKDELRPIYKIVKNGARTVECGPLDHLLLSRKYFGHFLNVVTKNPIKAFGCCVGFNPEVDLSYAECHLREYSDTGVAEDFTTWDGTIKPALIQAAGRVIESYYRVGLEHDIKESPKDKEALERQFRLDQNVRDVLLDEIAFTVHVSGKELCFSPTGLPSGHFFTSILNSLLHRIFNGLAWMRGTSKVEELNTMAQFDKHVRDLHYGDDGKDAVKRGVQPYYNRIVKGELAATLGMIYTMEDKESRMVPISKLDDCGFLKRKSIKHPTYRFIWNVPIEKRTIHSLINWVRDKGYLEDNLVEAFREAYHWGEEYYNTLKDVVAKALISKNILISIPTFSWQERAFFGRMGMQNNPYMQRQVIAPQYLKLGRMIALKEGDVISTNPLTWKCQDADHDHFCESCGREVFGLTKTKIGNICIACEGGVEPENYARPQTEKLETSLEKTTTV